MTHPHLSRKSTTRGFALVSVLALLLLVTILLVAFAVTMRTERSASENFKERDRGEAVAIGLLNRLVASYASPPDASGNPLSPFKVDYQDSSSGVTQANATALPTLDTVKNFYGTTANPTGAELQRLTRNFSVGPQLPVTQDMFEQNGLMAVSSPTDGGGSDAYDAAYWAYDGLTEAVMGSTDAEPGVVPKWVDYYETDSSGQKMAYPTAQIAYAIWDEGGKLDINMAGKDDSVNGIAPHDLKLEKLSTDSQRLLDYLNGNDRERQRNNFSLRRVTTSTDPKNDKGDDRWLFSVRELVEKRMLDASKFRQVTTISRDFDVRPEWDGDRAPRVVRKAEGRDGSLGSEDFVRTYINNPDLFSLFDSTQSTGPTLVDNTLNQKRLRQRGATLVGTSFGAPGSVSEQNWMQIMRMLAILRRSLPGSGNAVANQNILPYAWTNNDIWAIALNIMQAAAPASDHNLFAYEANKYQGAIYNDPNMRQGIRIGPYVTEMAVKIKNLNDTDYQLTEYIEVWNPYPFRLLKSDQPGTPDNSDNKLIDWRVGSWTTGYPGTKWPEWGVGVFHASLNDQGTQGGTARSTDDSWKNLTSPRVVLEPGEFRYVRLGPRAIKKADIAAQNYISGDSNGNKGLAVRLRDYVLNLQYYGVWNYGQGNVQPAGNAEVVYYAANMAMPYHSWDGLQYSTVTYIPPGMMPQKGGVAWYSFQIDDPRMGAYPRVATDWQNSTGDQKNAAYQYSWRGYVNKHSLDLAQMQKSGIVGEDPKEITPFYNGKSFEVTIPSGSGLKTATGKKTVAGFNANFGANWPGASTDTGVTKQEDFVKMMSTFALPGRPFLNVGELGNVFANRPWKTLFLGNTIDPLDSKLTTKPNKYETTTSSSAGTVGDPPPRPSAFLDYFTTVGTPTDDQDLYFKPPHPELAGPVTGEFSKTDFAERRQNKNWIFESVETTKGTNDVDEQQATGSLRPIRGRINLNTASRETLITLLEAPYRMPASIGLAAMGDQGLVKSVTRLDASKEQSDYIVEINDSMAEAVADDITSQSQTQAIRPLRNLSDLSRMFEKSGKVKNLLSRYPLSLWNAILGRLAQFGTVREQSYTVDLVIRTLNAQLAKKNAGAGGKGNTAITSEVRLQARISLDTFSRQAFVESLVYK